MRLPCKLVQEILTEVKFRDGDDALRNKTKQTKEILPFVTIPTIPTIRPHQISKRFS